MLRPSVVALCALVFVVPLATAWADPSSGPVPRTLTLWELGRLHGDDFPLAAPPPANTGPIDGARYMIGERPMLGRTPGDWVRWATHDVTAAPAAAAGGTAPAFVPSILRLHAIAGVPVGPADAAALEAATALLDPLLRDALARLTVAVADAYEAQLPIAAAVQARAAEGIDVHDVALLTIPERDAGMAAAERIVAAASVVEAVVAALPGNAFPTGAPILRSPEGLVVIGGPTDDVYVRAGLLPDPILRVDVGGNDRYEDSAGGACPDPFELAFECDLLAVAVTIDVAGNDVYDYAGPPAVVQGAGGMGGLGVLIDADGDDQYLASFTRTDQGPLFAYIDGGAQGFGLAGVGIQLDRWGQDLYRIDVASEGGYDIWAFGQGYGGAGGLGVSADSWGDDRWLTRGLGLSGIPPGFQPFQGIYTQGSSIYAGVGIMVDAGGGDDVYHAWDNATTTDYYAQGFGAYGGLGILYEDGGADDYYQVSIATSPWIKTLLDCAYGTGSIGGVGVFIELGGDDSYYGSATSPREAHTMNEGFGGIGAAYGLFLDLGGDDDHVMRAFGTQGSEVSGRGVALEGDNIIGNYLDLGGVDSYTGPGADDAIWLGGADINGSGMPGLFP